MRFVRVVALASLGVALGIAGAAPQVCAAASAELLREALRQQSAAERTACATIRRTLAGGTDPALVVRTAIELGYNSCETIRCALEGTADAEQPKVCPSVIRGAVAAGVPADVISRCSAPVCDPAAVAAILADSLLDLNYCYLAFRPPAAPEPPLPAQPVIDRSLPAQQASPFTF